MNISQNNEVDGNAADPDRRDSQLQASSSTTTTAKTASAASNPQPPPPPSSCFGHFDRLDADYTPKPGSRTVVLYHDSDAASSASSIERAAAKEARVTKLRQPSSRGVRDGRAAGGLLNESIEEEKEGGDGVNLRSRDKETSGAVGSVDAARTNAGLHITQNELSPPGDNDEDMAIDPSGVTTGEHGGVRDAQSTIDYVADGTSSSTTTPPSPGRLLTSLRVSDNAVPRLGARDIYFAGRLASACVILIRDGRISQAGWLGQWSVDMVGKELWDRMVVQHASAPRDVRDDEEWVRYLLGEVAIVLGHIDARRSRELQQMVLGWQAAGILSNA